MNATASNTRAEVLGVPAYASVVLNPLRRKAYYVSALPGQKGVDWGYTDKIEGYASTIEPGKRLDQALPLSPHWQRRFRADCERVDRRVSFIPVAGAKGGSAQ